MLINNLKALICLQDKKEEININEIYYKDSD